MPKGSKNLNERLSRLKAALVARLRAEAAWARVYAVEVAVLVMVGLLCAATYTPAFSGSRRHVEGKSERIARDNTKTFPLLSHDPVAAANLLVEAIIQVESAGNPWKRGRAGERGLMQIKPATWRETTHRLYGVVLPFDRAFDPEMNVRVGRAYLAELQRFLWAHRTEWQSDERELLLACYNIGPNRVARAGFNVRRLPAKVRDYVERATALHEMYLAEQGPIVNALLQASMTQPASQRI